MLTGLKKKGHILTSDKVDGASAATVLKQEPLPTVGAARRPVAVLATLSPAQLRHEWQKHCKSAAPDAGPTLLRLGIAYRLQARRQEGLDASALRRNAELGAVLDRDGALTTEPMARIKPGTRLVREWHGTTHQVLIIEKAMSTVTGSTAR